MILQKPGEKPQKPGKYDEVGPRGGKVPNARTMTMTPDDGKVPPTQKPGRMWKKR